MIRDSEVEERIRDKWVFDRGAELRRDPKQLVEALFDLKGETEPFLVEIIRASHYDATQYVLDQWINMVIQDEDSRGEWRE